MDVQLFKRDEKFKFTDELEFKWVQGVTPCIYSRGHKIKMIEGVMHKRLRIKPNKDTEGLSIEEFDPPENWIPDARITNRGQWPGWMPVENKASHRVLIDALLDYIQENEINPPDGEYCIKAEKLISQEEISSFEGDITVERLRKFFELNQHIEGLVWIVENEGLRPRITRHDL